MLVKSMEKTLGAQQKMMAANMEKQLGGKVDPEDMAAFQKKMLSSMIEAMNPEQMKKDMVQIYADNFTKEELSAMAAFNSTPAGKSMIEKQPEIQGRIQELMMPRMMAAMPKIGQMSKEFAQEQKAKIAAQAESAAPSASAPTGEAAK
jgi:hypothetical protein